MNNNLPEIIEAQLEYCLEEFYNAGCSGIFPPRYISERLRAIILAELIKAKNANQD